MASQRMKQVKQLSRAQWLRRLAARRADAVAFVFSGGGPYGAIQVGQVRALVERGIKPDLVVGTSAGALNAAFVAFDPSPNGIARLSAIWLNLEDDDLFPGARFRASWARMLMRGNRIFESSGLRRLIETRLGKVTFDEARIPLGVVATDLDTGAETLFSAGDVVEPLLASTAMPGIYPPVTIGGRTYIDGGVSNAVPISAAIAMGAKKIYVLNVSASKLQQRPLNRPMDYLLHAFMHSRAQRFELELPIYAQKAEIVVLPPPALDFSIPFTSMAHTKKLIQLGYEQASEYLATLTPPAKDTKPEPEEPTEAVAPAT